MARVPTISEQETPTQISRILEAAFARNRIILWILLAGLLIRVIALIQYGPSNNSPADAQGYFDSAVTFARTGRLGFYGVWPSAMTMPGFVILLSLPVSLSSNIATQYLLVKALLILLSLVSIYLAYLLGSKIGGRLAGIVASGLLAISPPSIYVANSTYVENLVMPIVLLLIYLFIRMADEPTPRRIAACIAVFCIGLYVREVVAVVGVIGGIYLLMRRYPARKLVRLVLLTGVIAAVALAPWWIRNYMAFDQLIVFTSNGSQPILEGTFQTFHPYSEASMRAPDELLNGFTGSLGEQNQLLLSEAKERIATRWRAEPIQLLFNYVISKPAATWTLPFYWEEAFGFTSWWVARLHALVAVTGMLLLIAAGFTSEHRAEFRAVLLLLLSLTLVCAITLGLARYVYSFIPLLYIAIGYGVQRLRLSAQHRARAVVPEP